MGDELVRATISQTPIPAMTETAGNILELVTLLKRSRTGCPAGRDARCAPPSRLSVPGDAFSCELRFLIPCTSGTRGMSLRLYEVWSLATSGLSPITHVYKLGSIRRDTREGLQLHHELKHVIDLLNLDIPIRCDGA